MDVFAVDIGGAFLKTSFLCQGRRVQRSITPFALWKHPTRLTNALKALRPKSKDLRVGITMTGELCDCFRDRREGVRRIVSAVTTVFGQSVHIFGRRGEFFSPSWAVKNFREVASANWVLTPLWLARRHSDFLLVDIGSTTTDLTPVRGGAVANRGWTDFERLREGELMYSGYLRTPVAAVVQRVCVERRRMPVAAETFANMGDVHLIRRAIGPARYNAATPDGTRPTVASALRRLARSLLADRDDMDDDLLYAVAQEIAEAQADAIVKAAMRFRLPVAAVGTGSFLLDDAFRRGLLEPHPFYEGRGIRTLDPSYALALLLKSRSR